MSFTEKFNHLENSSRHLLEEANLGQLYKKTKREKPEIDDRAMDLVHSVKFLGISDDCITLNFRINSQTYPGQYWYTSIEAPSILSEFSYTYKNKSELGFGQRILQALTDRFTPEHYNEFLLQKDFRVYTNDPSWLYWGNAYMATMGDYDIVPETRDSVIRNPRHKGALDKHAQAVVRCMYTNNSMKRQITKEINRVLRKRAGLPPDASIDIEVLQDQLNAKRGPRALLNNTSDFINNYFASKSNQYKFIKPNDVKQSLKADINKYIHSNPEGTLDTYLRDKFSMSKDSFAADMQVPKDEIDSYFDELGFTPKEDLAQEKKADVINTEKAIEEVTPDTTDEVTTEEVAEIDDTNKPNIV